jgi:hypothetical protein
MKDWHFEHMQKTIVKYIFGLSESEKRSPWKQKQYKKYGGIWQMYAGISISDIRHGVTREEVTEFLNKVEHDSSFSKQRKVEGSIERIKELEIEKG